MLPMSRSLARNSSESLGFGTPNGLVTILNVHVSPAWSMAMCRSPDLAFVIRCRSDAARLVTSGSVSASHIVSACPTFNSKYALLGHCAVVIDFPLL